MKYTTFSFFDDGNQSVFKNIPNTLSFGIQQKDTVYHLDMTRPFNELKIILDALIEANGGMPDNWVFSPVCSAFSRAAAMKYGDTKGNASFYWKDGKLVKRDKEHYTNTRYNADKQIGFAELSEKMVANTIAIIKHYKPKFWYIENPAQSLIWDYIKCNLGFTGAIRNVADYCMYGLHYKKSTCFLSNINLNLLKCDKKHTHIDFEYYRGDRSQIPNKLIQDIFKNAKEQE